MDHLQNETNGYLNFLYNLTRKIHKYIVLISYGFNGLNAPVADPGFKKNLFPSSNASNL